MHMFADIIEQVESVVVRQETATSLRASFLSCMRSEQVSAEEAIRKVGAVIETYLASDEVRIDSEFGRLPDEVVEMFSAELRELFAQESARFREGMERMRELVGIDTAYRVAHN